MTAIKTSDGAMMTDDQIIERCKAAGIKWIPPELPDECDHETGFPGSFDMVSMSEMRALLSTPTADPLQSNEPVGEFIGYQKIGFQQLPIIAWNRHVPMGTKLYDVPVAPAAKQAERGLTAIDADMVWPDYDTETFFNSIDDAVEQEISNAWPINVEQPTNGELELKLQLAKRIPTATIRIFNITENGHEWEIVAAPAASTGDQEVGS